MITEIRELVNQYTSWLKDNTEVREVNEKWVEITSPFLDRHNDLIQVYASKANGGFVISDDGYTINDLRLSGCELNTPKRQEHLAVTLNGFGVQQEGDALTVHADSENFAHKKHNLLQAVLAVNDLFYLSEPSIQSLFFEDVQGWLVKNQVRFIPKVKFTGKSGYDHFFDFAIPRSNGTPERIVNAINVPTKSLAINTAFAWLDTKEVRANNSKMYTILNDKDKQPGSDVLDALKSYNIGTVLWSARDEVLENLAK